MPMTREEFLARYSMDARSDGFAESDWEDYRREQEDSYEQEMEDWYADGCPMAPRAGMGGAW